MEGRISRESLDRNGAARTSETGSRERPHRYTHSAGKSFKRYSRRSAAKKKGAIPEGSDMFIVQLLASGLLLLFVMFVSIVDSSGTNALREKLNLAFSKNATLEEALSGVTGLRDRLSGGADAVLDIFGREVEDGEAVMETPAEPRTAEQDEDAVGAAVVEPELLKEINEYEDSQKN